MPTPLTPNIASPVFNILVLAFVVVVALGVWLAWYAAKSLKQMEDKISKEE